MEFETFSCIVYDRKMIKKKADCSMDSFKFQPRKISSDTIAIRLILDDYTRQTQFLSHPILNWMYLLYIKTFMVL